MHNRAASSSGYRVLAARISVESATAQLSRHIPAAAIWLAAVGCAILSIAMPAFGQDPRNSASIAGLGSPLPESAIRTQSGQAPGYYRFTLGDIQVIALLDGTHPFHADELAVGAQPGEVDALLRKQYLASPFEGGINAFLVKTPDKLVLIDAGAGDLYGKNGGLLVGNIRAAGFTPDQVDEIFLTHLHQDHVGGVLLSGIPVFPNATIRLSKTEADFWLNPANKSKAPAFLGIMFDSAQKVLEPYLVAGRVKPFEEDGVGALIPGITAIATPGHTPGQVAYKIDSKGQTLLVWGDIVHMTPVQFPNPKIAIKYDLSEAAAITTRETIFAKAAARNWWIAAAHISFPGIGHVRAIGDREYAWVPVNYSLNR